MKKSLDFWKKLTNLYFEGETSLEEEKMLRRFLASKMGQSSEFDDLRAVMSLMNVGKQIYEQSDVCSGDSIKWSKTDKRLNFNWVKWAVAAAIVMVFVFSPQKNVCEAYVYGQKLTDEEQIMQYAHDMMLSMQQESETMSVNNQLSEIFQTIQ